MATMERVLTVRLCGKRPVCPPTKKGRETIAGSRIQGHHRRNNLHGGRKGNRNYRLRRKDALTSSPWCCLGVASEWLEWGRLRTSTWNRTFLKEGDPRVWLPDQGALVLHLCLPLFFPRAESTWWLASGGIRGGSANCWSVMCVYEQGSLYQLLEWCCRPQGLVCSGPSC